ncbi:MAG TPA: hypothetical protein VFD52_01200 [Clostridia bacterium]|nr:hypothetical protein [Clostridia bacterium]
MRYIEGTDSEQSVAGTGLLTHSKTLTLCFWRRRRDSKASLSRNDLYVPHDSAFGDRHEMDFEFLSLRYELKQEKNHRGY